ncbi:heavy metal translocating P-type ATPase [Haloplanus aerogenes]|uniref:Cation-translocating P-type ATPase n=1 Tax=Haloplanus aerogenes TaxID=660522 RepID=A0A3M0DQS6_9EURY|nr:cation-translocating P-type ATPase [Haloplanus aerogenes]AZH24308.1 cation-translocating P-type ATPase [Haloplanus aerogenes]RMB24058.1 Cd2+/Zn2+-exporting ATPase [Haloplanus aerogenes]
MHWRRYYRKHRTAVVTGASGLLYAGGWSLGYVTSFDAASAAILVLAAVVGGYDIARVAVSEVRNRTLGIKTLVTLAAVGAVAIGAYWEAAAVVFLFSLGSYLEGRTMRKTRAALEELLELTPDTALVRRDGDTVEVPARDVDPGEVVLVAPGEKIPVDGEVVDGESSEGSETPRANGEPVSAVDQAPVTGESAPVHKRAGDEVYAGTINQAGALDVRTTGAGSDTTLQRIIRRVEAAQEAQSPTERLLDRFATYYTPGIVLLSVGAFVVTRDALLSLTLLVIGCPGALVIGPPVSVVSAIGNAARNGVLMKGGEHLERAGKIDLVAFDKTGTLTRGETAVADVTGFGHDADHVLRIAAIAERRSEHHLGSAIREAAERRSATRTDGGTVVTGTSLPDPDDFDVVPGKGVIAHHDGRELVVGNRALLDDRGIPVPDAAFVYVREREERGETAVHVALDGDVIGAVALRDELREAAPGVVRALRDAGVETVMLTGDNERTARAVAGEVGIDTVHAELLPEEKQTVIEAFRADGHVVAMVGDGINDAPSLATADVGIAMGAAGTDTAIETADMALMADGLERIPYAIGLSKAARWNVAENVGLATLTVGILLAGVLTSYVHLAVGMLVHEASVLAVILNGMRLLRY